LVHAPHTRLLQTWFAPQSAVTRQLPGWQRLSLSQTWFAGHWLELLQPMHALF
jgi:hypothetical protein